MTPARTKEMQRAVDVEAARRHFLPFVKLMFPRYEVNEVSKLVAAELEWFEREVEAGRSPRLILEIPPRVGKPVHEEAMVLMGDGSYRRLADVVCGDRVVGADGRSHEVLAVHEQGSLATLQIETMTGRRTYAAADHPFLTPRGWVKAGELEVGEALGNVARAHIGEAEVPDEAFRLAGYFVGDGSCSYVNAYKPAKNGNINLNAKITAFDELERSDIEHCAQVLGFGIGKPDQAAITLTNGVRDWLRATGLAGKTSHTKRVPEFVYRGTAAQIGHFLGAYFACDGHINARGLTRRGEPGAMVVWNSTQ